MKFSKLVLWSPALLLMAACSDDSNFDFTADLEQAQQQTAEGRAAEALFDAATGVLPAPNNFGFLGTEDGTLNLPLAEGTDPADFGDPRVALNTIDGFSTIEPIVTTFSREIDPASVVLGTTVKVFEATADPQTNVLQALGRELTAEDMATTVIGGTTLAFQPVKPLKESTNYVFVITAGVTNTAGTPSSPSQQFRLVSSATPLADNPATAALEPVRQATFPVTELVNAQEGVSRATNILTWTVLTQSITPVLAEVKALATARNIVIGPTGSTTSAAIPGSPGIADIFAGTMELPYYRTAPASANDPTGISSFWRGANNSFLTRLNPTPVATSTQTVPVLMTVPNLGSGRSEPADGWPIAVFVHGITANRTNLLAIADRMAQEGFAVIAIDQPMHGLTDTSNPFYAGANERTFNIDLVNNDTRAPGPDGVIDASGTHYYSPAALLASRDNLRQAAADLMVLSASLGNIAAVKVDTGNKTLIGHSLGGTVSTTLLAFDQDFKAATLGMPAAGIARMLIASESFGPALLAGLQAFGLTQGTADFEAFLTAAQSVIDSGDSINHATMAAANNTPIHIIEVVGNGADNPADQVVPNNVAGAPLAGTDPLARLLGFATSITAQTNGPGLVRFTEGAHSTLLNPAAVPASPAAFTEMQNQTAVFASTGGTLIQIDNAAVIQSAQ